MTSKKPSGELIRLDEIRAALEHERPELLEEWEAAGTLPVELARLTANAQWALARNEELADSWDSISMIRETGRLKVYSMSQAIWLATPDDLDRENTFDRPPDSEPLSETQLRSGWFAT